MSIYPASAFHRPDRKSQRECGFTLVELLVVIVIVGVLAALTFPVLSRVRGGADKITSLNNIRQLIVATNLYASDNNGFPPYGQGGTINGQTWQMWLASYLDYRPPGAAPDADPTNPQIWRTLHDKRPEGVWSNPASSALARGGNYSDYGINYRVTGHWTNEGRYSFLQIPEPSRVLLFAEARNCDRGVRDGWDSIASLHDGGRTALVAYVDGNVASLTEEKVAELISAGTRNDYPWGWPDRDPAAAQKHVP